MNPKKKKKKKKTQKANRIRTLAKSSRSLLGGASTFNGVIVAEATALAAYKTKQNKRNPHKVKTFTTLETISLKRLVGFAWLRLLSLR